MACQRNLEVTCFIVSITGQAAVMSQAEQRNTKIFCSRSTKRVWSWMLPILWKLDISQLIAQHARARMVLLYGCTKRHSQQRGRVGLEATRGPPLQHQENCMATKEKALLYAKDATARYGVEYCAIRARNGQWMCEKRSFVEGPLGKVLYPKERERVYFQPPLRGILP